VTAAVSKTVMGLMGPSRVRIPPPPLIVAESLRKSARARFERGAAGARMEPHQAEIAVCGQS
jgi:hypothetical protein